MQADCGNLENEFVDLKLQSTKTKRDSFDDDYSDDYVENVAQRVTSRSDRFSVEGSPCIARMRSIENFRERKKVDLHPTPLKFHITDDKLNEVVKQTSLKVLVLDSTPNDISHPERQILEHQENSFRTFLLCGEVPSGEPCIRCHYHRKSHISFLHRWESVNFKSNENSIAAFWVPPSS